jgi:HlyD family secretion protein
MAQRTIFAADRTIRRYLLGGVATCILLVGGAGSLAAVTTLSGAVIASGKLVVDSSVKKVQHPTGGVVGQIFVREGDAVQSGKVLIRLDETITRANLAIVTKSLDEFEARLARLEAERDGKGSITFPASLVSRQDAPEVGRAMAGEQSLFEFRRQARARSEGSVGRAHCAACRRSFRPDRTKRCQEPGNQVDRI